ncbi:MAG: WD40/YVTN/BNR-like repeat-containing protein [Ktedonobacteraceae bacterium]
MKTQNAKDTSSGTSIPEPGRRRNASWLAGLGSVLVVVLLIGVSVFVFTQARQHATNSTAQAKTPPAGTWTQVLQGYSLNSLVAAPNNPATLYACALSGQSSSSAPGTPAQGNTGSSQHFTVLHSSDFGAHWQAVGGNIALGYSCQIAINPTNSNDVYAAGTSTLLKCFTAIRFCRGNAPTGILLHSTDGGQTWSTIKPTLSIPGPTHAPAWSVQQITVAGGYLFGIQFVQSGGLVHAQSSQSSGMLLPRLVTSINGGQTWTILDTQLASTNMGVHDYAIDPSNIATIYELLGPAFGPIQPAVGAPKSIAGGIADALYKSTDGGSTWKLLLDNLPFGSQLQLAQNTPNILYVGGVRSPLPYAVQQNHPGTEPAFPLQTGAFNLHMSNDGGAAWHDVPNLPQTFFALSWFVGADGKVYAYSTNNLPGGSSGTGASGGQPTAIVATSVPVATPNTAPAAPVSSVNVVVSSQTSSSVAVPGSGNPAPTIERYDPNSNAWSTLTKPPVSGLMLAVTPTNTSSGAALWLFADSNGTLALYRYIA